jgi:hypothetical protein
MSLLRLLRILSLEACLAALSTTLYAAFVLESRVPVAWFVILPASIWLAYTLDHLLDGVRCKTGPCMDRHRFHYRFRRTLWLAWLTAFAATVGLSLVFLPPVAITIGLSLVLFLGLYLTMIQRLNSLSQWSKEFSCAAVFIAATWSMPLYYADSIDVGHGILILQLFALVLCNLLLFALRERRMDVICRFPSIVQKAGAMMTHRGINALLILTACSATGMWMLDSTAHSLLYLPPLLMSLGLLLTACSPRTLPRYRLIGDGVFCCPALFLLALYL